MGKEEILERIKKEGCSFIYNNKNNLTREQLERISINAIYTILNNRIEDKFYQELEKDIF